MAKAYKDPTADRAVGNIIRKERIRKKLFKDGIEKIAAAAGLHVIVTFAKGEQHVHHKDKQF
jgi:hypothetical protein